MLAQAAPPGPGVAIWVPVVAAVVGIVVGSFLTHLLERRRWHIEARKDAYVQFANGADQFVETAERIRMLLHERVQGNLYEPLHAAYADLRPTYYALRLLAPDRLALLANDIFGRATDFVWVVDPQGAGWGVERPEADHDDYVRLFSTLGPSHVQVDAFIEGARRDLTVDTRTARVVRAVRRNNPRQLYRRLRYWWYVTRVEAKTEGQGPPQA